MSIQIYRPLINEIDGFKMVGSGKAHYWCGIWQTYGCLHHKKAYVRQFKKTCFRSECKVCHIAWALRQANRTTRKLKTMSRNNTLHHAILTIPNSWNKESKKNLIKSLKKIGIESACLIHTPFDESNGMIFYLKNTIHLFYYGKMVNLYSLSAIRIKQLEDPMDLFKVLQTQFLNCGVKKGTHPISWIGRSLYCTLESEIKKNDGRNCPHCNRKLHLVYFSGERDPIPPDEYFDGDIEKKDWKYCFSESIWKRIVRKIKKLTNIIKNNANIQMSKWSLLERQ